MYFRRSFFGVHQTPLRSTWRDCQRTIFDVNWINQSKNSSKPDDEVVFVKPSPNIKKYDLVMWNTTNYSSLVLLEILQTIRVSAIIISLLILVCDVLLYHIETEFSCNIIGCCRRPNGERRVGIALDRMKSMNKWRVIQTKYNLPVRRHLFIEIFIVQ